MPIKCSRSLSPQLLVLKYVQNKDVFMRYHKTHLTRRLILETSADTEKEENMVEWLRVGHMTRHMTAMKNTCAYSTCIYIFTSV